MSVSVSLKKYEQLEHTGDLRIKVYGKSTKELFMNSAYALFDLITDAENIKPNLAETLEVAGADQEELLVNWLSELNYLFLTESKVFNKFEIDRISEREISATVLGEKHDNIRHPIKTEIKAVTFHDLEIVKVSDHLEAKIVFDI